MMRGRIKVACINWGSPDAPHAVGYILQDGIARNHTYFPSHADAMGWADRLMHLVADADRVRMNPPAGVVTGLPEGLVPRARALEPGVVYVRRAER